MNKNALKIFWTTVIVLFFIMASGVAGLSSESKGTPEPSMIISPNVIKYKVTKTVQISGTGFTPDAVLTIGIPGLGQQKKAPGSKDLWWGIAMVDQSRNFNIKVGLRLTLWRVKGLSGKYDVVAKDQQGKIVATAPLIVEKAK